MDNTPNSSQNNDRAADWQNDLQTTLPANKKLLDFLQQIDRTWLSISLIFLFIAIGLPQFFVSTISFTATNLWHITPFLLLSASVAGYLEAADADRLKVARHAVQSMGSTCFATANNCRCACVLG